jgi:hypothetical protein
MLMKLLIQIMIATMIDIFSMKELNLCLKSLKLKLSCGTDGINNFHLKNASQNIKELLLRLFNCTIIEGKLPDKWKETVITMITKKSTNKSDPENY